MTMPISLRNPINQLRWKLTLRYTAVTVAVLVTLEAILLGVLGVGLIGLVNSGILPQQLIQVGEEYTPVLRTYLDQSPPDQEGIANLLNWFTQTTTPTIPLSFDATDDILVIGADGTLLGATSPEFLEGDRIGQPFDPQSLPGSEIPLQAALEGTDDIKQLYSLDNSSKLVVLAIPVWDENHQDVLGVVIAVTDTPTLWSVIGEALPILGVSLLLFTLLAGLTGTLFGYLAARGLTNRFNQVTKATLSWSKGDFSANIDDHLEDELGQLAQRLNTMSDQLQSLFETRQTLAIIEERNRIARDLHDSAKQQAFALAAQLDAAQAWMVRDSEVASRHLAEAERIVDELRTELTHLIQELHPVMLQGKGLAGAIRVFAERWSRQSAIKADLDIQGERLLSLTVEESLFRIVQEALSNVARHSQATQVVILLHYRTDGITLSIADNGQGINSVDEGWGLGLRSMQERTETLGGRFRIESLPTQGTRLTYEVPIDASKEQ